MPSDAIDPIRSRMMAGIGSKNTKPELVVRRGLHRHGFRFRLHDKNLPGKPDIVLRRWGAVIFTNGCFWHGHDCDLFRWPQTRKDFWIQKIENNRARDARNQSDLISEGWRVLVIWECAMKGKARIGIDETVAKAASWLRSNSRVGDIRGGTIGDC